MRKVFALLALVAVGACATEGGEETRDEPAAAEAAPMEEMAPDSAMMGDTTMARDTMEPGM